MIAHPEEPPAQVDPRAELSKAGYKSPFAFHRGQVTCPHGGCRFPRQAARVHRSYDTADGRILLGIECPVCHAHGVLEEPGEAESQAA